MDSLIDTEYQLLGLLSAAEEGLDPRDLRAKAAEKSDWNDVSLAFWRLLNQGRITLTDSYKVRASTRAAP